MPRIALSAVLLLMLGGCVKPTHDYAAVERDLRGSDENFFLLGAAQIGEKNNLPERIVSLTEYGDMKCAAAAGYLRFTVDPAEPAIGKDIAVELTPQGEAALKTFTEDDASRDYEATRVGLDLFKIRLSRTSIDEILSDTATRKASGYYRTVEFTTRRTLTPDGKRYFAACPQRAALAGPGHARILLRRFAWEPWEPIAGDTVPAGKPFTTDYVGQTLDKM